MDNIAGFDVNIQSVTLAALGVLAVVAIFKGWLLPKPLVDSLLKSKDETIEAQNKTIEAYQETAAATDKLLKTFDDKAKAEKVGSDGT